MRSDDGGQVRQLQVAEQCADLASALELLEKSLLELQERLHVVLRSEDMIKEEKPVKQAETLVPHADNLRQRVWHVQKLQNMVSDILHRIEI